MHNPAHPFLSASRGRVASSWAILALALITAGCSSTSAAVPAAAATPTVTPVAVGGGSDSTTEDIGDGDGAGDSTQPEQAQETLLAGSVPCLPGTWSVDRASLASYIEEAMNVTSATAVEIESSQGELMLTFDAGEETTYQAEDLEFEVRVMGLTNISVVIQGEGILQRPSAS